MKKIDEIRIGDAMNRRLSSLEASGERRARIRARIERERQTDAPGRGRRFPGRLAFALASVLALSGIAMAAGIGLFEMYGGIDERMANLNRRVQKESRETVVIETEELGRTEAAIDDVYYDGQTLIASLRIDGGVRVEARIPTGEEMEGAHPGEYLDTVMWTNWVIRTGDSESAAVCEAFNEAVKNGEPAGLAFYFIESSWDGRTDDGVDLGGCSVNDQYSTPEAQYEICEFGYPLPEEAQNRERLDFGIGLRKRTTYYLFDGGQMYVKTIMEDAGWMQASVRRSETQSGRYSGGGTCRGLQVQAEGEMSAASGSVMLTTGRDLFDQRHVYAIYADGQRLDLNYMQISEDGHSVTVTFYAMGLDELPEKLDVYLLYKGEDSFYSHEENLRRSDVIHLESVK